MVMLLAARQDAGRKANGVSAQADANGTQSVGRIVRLAIPARARGDTNDEILLRVATRCWMLRKYEII